MQLSPDVHIGRLKKLLMAFLLLVTASLTLEASPATEEMVVIDPSVQDYETLISGVRPGVDVLLLEKSTPALAQIAAALAERRDVRALHIVSHGTPGAVSFNEGAFTAAGIGRYDNELKSIGAVLGERGEILLYGCNVGQGEAGGSFIADLARATGASVAASTNYTGANDLGGDWTLERNIGSISTTVPFHSAALASFRTVLQVNLTCPAGGSTTFVYGGANGSCVTTAPIRGNLRYAVGNNCAAATNDPITTQGSCGCCPIFNGDCIRYTNTNPAATTDVFVIGGITYNVTISGTPPTVTTHPSNATRCAGTNVSFSAAATGSPTPTVQWQRSTDGGTTFNNIAGATGTTHTFTTLGTHHGHRFRAVFTNAAGSATSNHGILTVNEETLMDAIPTANDADNSVCAGTSVTYTGETTTMTGNPTFKWQSSTDGGNNFTDISGATGTTTGSGTTRKQATYTFTAALADNGKIYRVVFSNPCAVNPADPFLYSDPTAALTVNAAPTITTHPSNTTLCSGGNATFTAAATGTPSPTVQWQLSTDGGSTFGNVAGATSTTLSVNGVTTAMNARQYRAVFTNACGSTNTNAATLTVNTAPVVTTQPSNLTVCAGSSASFTVAFTGQPTPTVQWQISTNGGTTFINIAGGTNPTLTFTTIAAQNNNRFRAILNNICGGPIISNAAILTVNTAGAITAHPANTSACVGSNATFTASASGSPTPTVQWQQSTDGGTTFNNIAGATSTTLSFAVTVADDGRQYRAVFSNSCGAPLTTNNATLTAGAAPVVTTHPTSVFPCADGTVNFTAAATGFPTPTVQWQLSTDAGSSWNDISGETSLTYSFSATAAADDDHQYRARFSNTCGSNVATNAATLDFSETTTITAHPSNTTVCPSGVATFTAAATGVPTPTVQWEVSADGGSTWNPMSGETNTTLSFTATVAENSNQYRAVFSNTCSQPAVATSAATLTLHTPVSVTSNPSNTAVCVLTTATFSVAASGNPMPTVQWEVSTDGGSTWNPLAGETGTTLAFTATFPQNNNQYRAVFTNVCGSSTTTAATLTVMLPTGVVQQPNNRTVCAGSTATFQSVPGGNPTPTVQWQQSTDGGSTWVNIAGATSTTLSFATVPVQNGNQFRAMFSNPCGVPVASDPATLAVNTATVITANPTNTTTCAGSNASFSVAFTSTPTATVQWQISTNGGTTFVNIAGATSPTLTFVTVGAQNNNQFRAVLSNACGAPVTSTAATLTVNTVTTITANPSDMTVCAGSSASFTATATANQAPTVQWQQSTDGGSSWVNIAGATSTTLSFVTVPVQNGNQFRAMFSNACGAPVASNPATLNVNTATVITANPTNTTTCAGSNASFSVAFTSTPTATVQWQISTNGGTTFVNIAGATSPTLTFVTVGAQNNNQFRAVLSNACGAPVTSTAATLTVNTVTTVTAQPSDMTVCAGSSASFTATATANAAPTVQWQQSTDGGSTWVNIAGATSTTLSFATVPVQNGNRFRAMFSNACGAPVASNPATLNVNTSTVITADPTNTTACAGSNASFSVAFTGVPTASVQWQISTNGGTTFVNIAGATSPTLTFVTVAAQNNNQFRAVLSNSCGAPVTSAAATLTVNTVTTVTQQPVDGTTCEGGTISFTSTATGNPAPTVQWQVSTNGGATWAFINGAAAQTNTIAFTVSRGQNGHMFRAMFSNACGTPVFSIAARMNVHWASTITQQPVDETDCENTTTNFSIAVDANPSPTIQWQISTNGGTTWLNINGLTGPNLQFNADMPHNGNLFRATVTNACGAPLTSNAAQLTVHTPTTITQNPSNTTVCVNSTATFTASATSNPTPTVQWQISTDGGSNWTNIAGATSTTLSFTTTASQSGHQFRAVFSEAAICGGGFEPTTAATLTVNVPPVVTQNPTDQIGCAGDPITFTSAGTGTPNPTIQWQVSTDGGSTFTDVAGANSATLTFTMTVAQNGNRYRATYTNACGAPVPTTSALLTVGSTPTIVQQPQPTTVCFGYPATFTVTASAPGGIPLTYQWMREDVDLPGETGASLTIPFADMNSGNKRYSVRVTACSTTVTSSYARLTVLPPPTLAVTLDKPYIYSTDHSMRTVNATVSSSGGCSTQVRLHAITSSEPDAGAITGDVSGDIVADSIGVHPGERTFQLRAEAGANGRVYQIIYRLDDGAFVRYDTSFLPSLPTGTRVYTGPTTGGISLDNVDPNPMATTSNITITLPSTCATKLSLYTLTGVWLMDISGLGAMTPTGQHTISWNGLMPSGAVVPNGTYMLQLKGCSAIRVMPLTIMRSAGPPP